MRVNDRAERLSLDGTWQIDIGGQRGAIIVPGVWEVQGYPPDVNRATLHRTVDVPAAWADASVWLRVGAASYAVTVRVNGETVGSHTGLWTPFEFDVTNAVRPGERNQITVHVVKPSNTDEDTYPYREVLVGFVPYISSTFGGIWQSAALIAHRTATWRQITVRPDADAATVSIAAVMEGAPSDAEIEVLVKDAEHGTVAHYRSSSPAIDCTLTVPDARLWQPDAPYLYTLELRAGDAVATRRFGFRRLHAEGRRLLLNHQPVTLRGVLSWGWNPDTLAPTFSDDEIRAEFRRVREYGFNLYKLCLYVPPENVFRIADEEGMLLWLELPMWWQRDNPHLREELPQEYADILARVHYHPSVVLYSLGCEIEGDMIEAGLVHTLEHIVRSTTTGILLCENSGSGEAFGGHATDIADFYDYHFYSEAHHFQPMVEHFRRDWRAPRPWLFGEFAAQDDYRDPSLLEDGDGERLWWRDLLGTDGGLHRWAYCEQEARTASLELPFTDEQMVAIGRRQSYALRKLILEATRRYSGMGGYVITGLRDTPITTSGLWDDQQQSKYTQASLHHINSANVLLLEQGRRRVWIDGDQPRYRDRFNHRAGAQVAFDILFSGVDAPAALLRWHVTRSDGQKTDGGEQTVTPPLLDAQPHKIGRIEWTFPQVSQPTSYELAVSVGVAENRWMLWTYPDDYDWQGRCRVYDPSGVLPALKDFPRADFTRIDGETVIIASAFTDVVRGAVAAGANLVLVQPGLGALPAQQVSFWQESLHLFYDHPLWQRLPTLQAATEQFYHVASGYAFDSSQTAYTPVVRRLHTRLFTTSDMLVEMRVGSGRVLATTLNLFGGAGDQATGLDDNVFGNFLLAEMVRTLLQRDG